MAVHLLATPTISDGVWTSEPRLPRETRQDFVRRVLLGETPESEPDTPEAEAAELAGVKRGYYLLDTDGGNSGDQVNGVSAVRQAHLSELHEVASSLRAHFQSIRFSWVPREMNAEADRLVRDALGALD
jgi:Reverse transcriptase-like